MTQKERQDRSRREILRAAMEEFGTHGYDSVSMENICTRHGISKGMMYHYFSNKDDLFLLCVKDVFQRLQEEIEQRAAPLEEQDAIESIQGFFMIRESYFQQHPHRKLIFETALLRPPRHLAEQIHTLRGPIRELNRQFLVRTVSRLPLRDGLSPDQAIRYLECLNTYFWPAAVQYQRDTPIQDTHSMLQAAEEIVNLALFGIARRQQDFFGNIE